MVTTWSIALLHRGHKKTSSRCLLPFKLDTSHTPLLWGLPSSVPLYANARQGAWLRQDGRAWNEDLAAQHAS
jgi:hypothetical protein